MLAGKRSADEGRAGAGRNVQAGEYNPAWLLVGDRQSLYYIALPADEAPVVHQLTPGVHVLENVALGESSPKVDRIRSLVSAARSANTTLWTALPSVLADHTVPVTADGESSKNDASRRRPEISASCVPPKKT